jgi:uncharacterized protein YecE (DUF72 family)
MIDVNGMRSVMAVDQQHGWPVRLLYRDYLRSPATFAAHVERFRESLTLYLRAWERHAVRFGTSSWIEPRWIGMLYGRWYGSTGDFVSGALEEYARVFTTLCLDVGPYCPPSASWLQHLNEQLPQQAGVVVADETLMYRFPYGHPIREKRGELNRRFLDAEDFGARLCASLRPLATRIGMVMLPLARIYATDEVKPAWLLRRLDAFLAGLPREYRYAVELANPEFTLPEYLACLRAHGVAHVLRHEGETDTGDPFLTNADRRPSLLVDQLQVPGILTAEFCVVRVARQHPPSDLLLGIRELVRRCVRDRVSLSVFVDTGAGRPAPLVILELLTALNPELAQYSPIKRQAA